VDELFSRRVALITGKGGVGRTTLSGALAIAGARRGLRVLVTEVTEVDAEYTPLARLFGRDTLPIDPVELAPGVAGCMLYSRRGHERFFARVLPIPMLVNAALGSSALRKMLEAAPSLTEMGIFYHLITLVRAERSPGVPLYDLVLVDMPASGHTLGLTGLPERILEVMPRGPIAKAMREGQELLYDPAATAAWVVTLPELLPVTEALELLEGLERDKLALGGVILNRYLVDEFTPAERAALDGVLDGAAVYGKTRFDGAKGSEDALERLSRGTSLRVDRVAELPEVGRKLLEAIADGLVGAKR
jgi:anion-transporting  ArsA/GET3 family ATPase